MSRTFNSFGLTLNARIQTGDKGRGPITEHTVPNEFTCWSQRSELSFEELPRTVQDELRAVIQRRSYAPGEAIFLRGEQPKGLYRIDAGVVKVTRQMPEGPEGLILDLRDRGESLGEETLFDGQSHATSAWVLDSVDVSFVPRGELWALMRACPEFLGQLIEIYAFRIQRAQDKLSMFYFADVEARLAAVVLGLADRFGRVQGDGIRLSVKLHRWDWAQLVGARVETVSRVFSHWTDCGWIHNGAGTLTLLDPTPMVDCAKLLD